MASENQVVEITVPAGLDMSAFQYRAVQMLANGSAGTMSTLMSVGHGKGTAPFGILTNKPAAAGRGARIAVGGVAKMVCGAASIAAGALVTAPGMGGQGSSIVTTDSGTTWVLGIAKTRAAASGDIFEVIIAPHYHSNQS